MYSLRDAQGALTTYRLKFQAADQWIEMEHQNVISILLYKKSG